MDIIREKYLNLSPPVSFRKQLTKPIIPLKGSFSAYSIIFLFASFLRAACNFGTQV